MRHGPLHGHPLRCGRCGQRITAIHDLDERCVRDLPQFDHSVDLRVRVVCANRLRSDQQGRQVVKGARWRVLGCRHSPGPAEDVRLEEPPHARRAPRCVSGPTCRILAHRRWPAGTNLVEGINNMIKVINRAAYRYRGDACFFRKIRADLPGVGR